MLIGTLTWAMIGLPMPLTMVGKLYVLQSPDKKRECQVRVQNTSITLVSKVKGSANADTLKIGFELGSQPINYKQKKLGNTRVNALYQTQTFSPQRHRLNAQQFEITFTSNRRLQILLADEGLAYRWQVVSTKTDTVTYTIEERLKYTPAPGAQILGGRQPNPDGSFEDAYTRMFSPRTFPQTGHMFLPMVGRYAAGQSVLVTEADLRNYPVLFFTHPPGPDTIRHHLQALWQRYPRRDSLWGYKNYVKVPNMRMPYMARLRSGQSSPWRCFAYADNDKKLAYNPFSALVSSYSIGADRLPAPETGPGLVQWDWWHDWNIPGAPFKTGINTATYKYYVDYASANKIPYILLDDGWTEPLQPDKLNPELDMPVLLAYAKQKNVKLMVWCLWHKLDEDPEKYLKQWADWGIAGVKVDFFDRADQRVIQSAEIICQIAAKHNLLLNFHGFPAPMGLHLRYPNLLTTEGILGNEYNKWSHLAKPVHQVNLVFVRGNGGPFDYTTGAMQNRTQGFHFSNGEPASQSSLAGEVAKYILYDSPLQMLCDAPSRYAAQPNIEKLITTMPTVWDSTLVLEAQLNSHLLVARRHGTRWYIGALNGTDKELTISANLTFLKKAGKLTLLTDGINTSRLGSEYEFRRQPITPNETIPLKLSKNGGGAVMVIE